GFDLEIKKKYPYPFPMMTLKEEFVWENITLQTGHIPSNFGLQGRFLTTPQVRPKYAALHMSDQTHMIEPLPDYGKSFVVFQDRIKLNCLFVPNDSYKYGLNSNSHFIPCTFHHFDLFLHQCGDGFLKVIADRVKKGM